MPKASKSASKFVTKSASPKHNLRTFGEALGLSLETDKDAFDDIRKRLRELMEKHFNINLTMQRQSAASWKNIDAEIRKDMPNIYSTPERRNATRRYMKTHFATAGWIYRKAKLADRQSGSRCIAGGGSDDDTETVVEALSHMRSGRPSRDTPDSTVQQSASRDPPSVNAGPPNVSQEISSHAISSQSSSSSIRDLSNSSSLNEPEEFVVRIIIERTVKAKSLHSAIQIAEECQAMLTSREISPRNT